MYPTIVIRYRLSLDVEVDGEKKTSSGVVEVAYNILPNSLSFAGSSGDVFSGRMRGAAITVDLGSHGIAFVANCASLAPQMLRSQSVPLWDLPWVAFKPYAGEFSFDKRILLRRLQNKKDAIEVPIEQLPLFVRFVDIDDPRSIEEVDPRDLSETYGPGVRLLHAKIEITDDPVSPIPTIWPKWLLEAKAAGFLMERNFPGPYAYTRFGLQAFKGD
jgi:hypothetical protein